jgi:hypothetical protein
LPLEPNAIFFPSGDHWASVAFSTRTETVLSLTFLEYRKGLSSMPAGSVEMFVAELPNTICELSGAHASGRVPPAESVSLESTPSLELSNTRMSPVASVLR